MKHAGYSGTPLAQKLGIKPGARLFVASPPVNYRTLVAPLPGGTTLARQLDGTIDVAHVFATRKDALSRFLRLATKKMRPDATIWVSWPKKAANVSTDICEETVRAVALPLGLVDIKVCAVDEVWSGLKLVVRKELR
jgi:hypothetical protein